MFIQVLSYMKKISLLIILTFVLQFKSIGQNLDSLLKNDLHSVTSQLMYMLETDQLFRNYLQTGKFGFNNGKWNNPEEKEKLNEFEKDLILDSVNYYHAKQISYEIDSLNTVNLIRITKTYGFPSDMRLSRLNGKVNVVGIANIFIHSPPIFFDQIRELIYKEFKGNRLLESDYRHILWHLRGRKDNIFELMTIPIEELEKR